MIGSPYLSGLHNGQNATIFTPGEVPTIILLLVHANDDVFEKGDSPSFWSPHTLFRHIWLFWNEEPDKSLALDDLKSKSEKSLFTFYSSLITVHFLLFIGTIHYAFYSYLRGDVPYIKQNSLEPELSLGLLLSFRIPL